jgi:uncharacterized protein YndB with AHSA1/START domain
MDQPAVVHDTFILERTYAAARAKVFSFLADPAKKRRWFAEGHGHDTELFELDFRVGGAERTRYVMGANTPFPGTILATEGVVADIVDGCRVVIAATMSLGERRISTAIVTFELLDKGEATVLVCTHQAVFYEGADGPEMRKGGWEALLDRLGQVVAA